MSRAAPTFFAPHRSLTEHLIVLSVVPGGQLVAFGCGKHRPKGQKIADSDKGVPSVSEFRHKQGQGPGGVVASTVGMADDDRAWLRIFQHDIGDRFCALAFSTIFCDHVPLDCRQV